MFDDAALKAIARWRYNPKVEDGVAVERVGVQTVIRFQLAVATDRFEAANHCNSKPAGPAFGGAGSRAGGTHPCSRRTRLARALRFGHDRDHARRDDRGFRAVIRLARQQAKGA